MSRHLVSCRFAPSRPKRHGTSAIAAKVLSRRERPAHLHHDAELVGLQDHDGQAGRRSGGMIVVVLKPDQFRVVVEMGGPLSPTGGLSSET